MSPQLGHQIDTKELYEGLLELLDKYSCGVIVFNDDGSPILINTVGQQILNSNDGLRLLHEKVSINSVPAQSVVKHIIRKFIEGELRDSHNEMVFIPRPSGKPPYQLMATPLKCKDDFDAPPSLLAFFIFDPEEKQLIRAEQLKQLYGLTVTESKLAILIAQGKGLDECAALLKHKISTSRNLLKRIFLKTGTSKQHELTALVLNQTIPLRVNNFTTSTPFGT